MGCNNSTATNSQLPQQKGGQSVLFVIASPMGQYSVSQSVAQEFINEYQKLNPNDRVVPYNLNDQDIPPFNASRVQAKFQPFTKQELSEQVKKEWDFDVKLIDDFKSFDKFVVALPTWNWTIPNNFKLYIDHIVQPGLTFDAAKMSDPAGPGLVKGKPILFVSAAGGPTLGGPTDYLTPFVNTVFGFIGFSDIKHVYVNESQKPESKELAIKQVLELVPGFKFDPNARPEQKSYPEPQPVTESYGNGNRVLYVTCSPMGDYSSTNTAIKSFIDQYKQKNPEATFDHIDLANDNIKPFTANRVLAKFSGYTNSELTEQAKEEWDYTLQLIDQFKSYDTYIFGVPMWNLFIPYSLKLYFDQIVQPFKTFDGLTYQGLVTGRRAYVFASSGSGILDTPYDHVIPYTRFILGMIGFKDIQVLKINGTSDPQQKQANIDNAVQQASQLL